MARPRPLAGTELTVAVNRVGGIEGGPRAGCEAPAEGSAGGVEPDPDTDPGDAELTASGD